jgi:hypothetical protein
LRVSELELVLEKFGGITARNTTCASLSRVRAVSHQMPLLDTPVDLLPGQQQAGELADPGLVSHDDGVFVPLGPIDRRKHGADIRPWGEFIEDLGLARQCGRRFRVRSAGLQTTR